MIGLRGSGKTTFLAALWHLVEAGELPSALTAASLQPDREYLNGIRDGWLRLQEAGRTSVRSVQSLSLLLQDSATGELVDVSLPDLSGETLRLQWTMRRATTAYSERASNATGAFLFIHPKSIVRPARIGLVPSVESTSDGIDGLLPDQPQHIESNSPLPNAWVPDFAPTAVQLVDLLQVARNLRTAQGPFRLSVIISAWDVVRERVSPSAWLERRLPLLFQYLTANSSDFPFKAYGVSALGGDLSSDMQRLRLESTPSRRIRVLDDANAEHHDLSAPLRFLLRAD